MIAGFARPFKARVRFFRGKRSPPVEQTYPSKRRRIATKDALWADKRIAGTVMSTQLLSMFHKSTVRSAKGAPRLRLTSAERAELEQCVRRRTSAHRLVLRSRIVLLVASGLPLSAVARRLHVSRATVRLWWSRFQQHGIAALSTEAPGRGRRPGMTTHATLGVLQAMLADLGQQAPMSTRSIARHAKTSASTVWRVWRRFGLGPESPESQIHSVIAQVISEARGGTPCGVAVAPPPATRTSTFTGPNHH